MTPKQFKEARHKLRLSVNQMAKLLDINPQQVRRFEINENLQSHRPVMPITEKLIRAWLDGYRPSDWPVEKER